MTFPFWFLGILKIGGKIMEKKFGNQIINMLLLMLFVSLIGVSAVSALDQDDLIEENYVPVENALENAKQTLNDFLMSGAFSTDKEINNITVSPSPTFIYDINGMLLYYQFSIESDEKEIGVIKAAANKILGCTICTIEETPSYLNYSLVLENSKNMVQKTVGSVDITSAKFVCYSYPKIGVMVKYYNVSSREEDCVIVDAYDNEIVSENSSGYTDVPAIWSVYQEIPPDEYSMRIKKWNTENSSDVNDFELSAQPNSVFEDRNNTITTDSTFHFRKLWCSNNLVPQPNSVWCGVASGKMIAVWMCSSHTMNHIADEMDAWNNAVNPPEPRGVTWDGQINYYDGSQPDGLDCYLRSYWNNYMVTWDTAYDHIETYNSPLTSSITGHVRVCAGWGYYDGGNEYLYIFDPAPVNIGSTKWENWDSITHYGYILVD